MKSIKGSEDMFYYSKNSRNKIIHVRGCHYIKNTDEAKLGDFKTVAAAYREGYNPCHHCSNILKLYRKEKKKVAKYKKENAIVIRLFPRYIEIKTDCGEWRILPSSTQGKTHLFHKNYKHRRSDYESEIPGFHDQCVSRNTLKDYVGYIVHHDKERAAEIKNEKKSPMDTPPKKTKGKSHKRYCKQMKAYKNRQRKKRIRELWFALECLAVS